MEISSSSSSTHFVLLLLHEEKVFFFLLVFFVWVSHNHHHFRKRRRSRSKKKTCLFFLSSSSSASTFKRRWRFFPYRGTRKKVLLTNIYIYLFFIYMKFFLLSYGNDRTIKKKLLPTNIFYIYIHILIFCDTLIYLFIHDCLHIKNIYNNIMQRQTTIYISLKCFIYIYMYVFL